AANGTVDSLSISLGTFNDTIVEGPEDYTVTISAAGSPTGATVVLGAPTAVTTTITDNDTATWSLTGGASVVEGAAATYTLALAATLQAGEKATVDLALSFPANGPSLDAADANDFTNAFLTDVAAAIATYNATAGVHGQSALVGSTLTYTQGAANGTVDSLSISLGTFDDSIVEGPEDYTLTISAAGSPTGATVVLGAQTTVTTTITDNDTATWSLTGGASVVEGAAASYTLALAGTLQAGAKAPVDLALSFPANGPSLDAADANDFTNAFLTDVANAIATYNATAGVHGQYALVGSTLTYTQGAANGTVDSLSISLGTFDDSIVEGPEDYTLTISAAGSPTGATVVLGAQTTVTTTITDNDTATWSLTGGASVAEGAAASYTLALAGTLQAGEKATVDLARSFPANGPSLDAADANDFTNAFLTDVAAAIATYNTTPGVHGQYALVGSTLTYTQGAANGTVDSLSISLGTFNDSIVEGPEDYTVTISAAGSPPGATVVLGAPTTVTTTITDNDTATWSLTGGASVVEGAAATYTLALAGTLQAGEKATVDLALSFPANGPSLDAAD